MLNARYIGFIENLSATMKPHLQTLFNLCIANQACKTGQNVSHLLKLYELNDLRTLIREKQVIKNKRIHPLQEEESWKVEMIEEMCLTKMSFIEGDEEEKDIIWNYLHRIVVDGLLQVPWLPNQTTCSSSLEIVAFFMVFTYWPLWLWSLPWYTSHFFSCI